MMKREREKAPAARNGSAPVPVRATVEGGGGGRKSLRAYLRGEANEVDDNEIESAIRRVSELRSSLLTVRKRRFDPGTRALLAVRIAQVHRLVAAQGVPFSLKPAPAHTPGAYGLGSSQAPTTAGAAERGISLAEGAEKSGQPGESP